MTVILTIVAILTLMGTAFAAETETEETFDTVVTVSNINSVRVPAFQDENGTKFYCVERAVKAPDANGTKYKLVGEYSNELMANIFARENVSRDKLNQSLVQFAVWGAIEGQEVGRNFAQFHFDEVELESYDALFASTMDTTDTQVNMTLWESIDGEHQRMISYEIITPVEEPTEEPQEPMTETPEVPTETPEEPAEPTTEAPAEPEAPSELPEEPAHTVKAVEAEEVEETTESFVPNTDGEALVFAGIVAAMCIAVIAVICVRRSTRKYRLG